VGEIVGERELEELFATGPQGSAGEQVVSLFLLLKPGYCVIIIPSLLKQLADFPKK